MKVRQERDAALAQHNNAAQYQSRLKLADGQLNALTVLLGCKRDELVAVCSLHERAASIAATVMDAFELDIDDFSDNAASELYKVIDVAIAAMNSAQSQQEQVYDDSQELEAPKDTAPDPMTVEIAVAASEHLCDRVELDTTQRPPVGLVFIGTVNGYREKGPWVVIMPSDCDGDVVVHTDGAGVCFVDDLEEFWGGVEEITHVPTAGTDPKLQRINKVLRAENERLSEENKNLHQSLEAAKAIDQGSFDGVCALFDAPCIASWDEVVLRIGHLQGQLEERDDEVLRLSKQVREVVEPLEKENTALKLELKLARNAELRATSKLSGYRDGVADIVKDILSAVKEAL